MKWKKTSPQILDIFDHVAPEGKSVEKRKMFGYPCRFMNNNMFMGVHGEKSIFLRLSDRDREEFLKLDEAKRFEPMPGRIMKEYVVIPQWMLENRVLLNDWVKKSLTYVSSLPPKVRKKGKKKAIRKG